MVSGRRLNQEKSRIKGNCGKYGMLTTLQIRPPRHSAAVPSYRALWNPRLLVFPWVGMGGGYLGL